MPDRSTALVCQPNKHSPVGSILPPKQGFANIGMEAPPARADAVVCATLARPLPCLLCPRSARSLSPSRSPVFLGSRGFRISEEVRAPFASSTSCLVSPQNGLKTALADRQLGNLTERRPEGPEVVLGTCHTAPYREQTPFVISDRRPAIVFGRICDRYGMCLDVPVEAPSSASGVSQYTVPRVVVLGFR